MAIDLAAIFSLSAYPAELFQIIPEHQPMLSDFVPWREKEWRYIFIQPQPQTDDMRQMIEDIANANL